VVELNQKIFAPSLVDGFYTVVVCVVCPKFSARPVATYAATLMCVDNVELIFARE
jgi:hypothetical protein